MHFPPFPQTKKKKKSLRATENLNLEGGIALNAERINKTIGAFDDLRLRACGRCRGDIEGEGQLWMGDWVRGEVVMGKRISAHQDGDRRAEVNWVTHSSDPCGQWAVGRTGCSPGQVPSKWWGAPIDGWGSM